MAFKFNPLTGSFNIVPEAVGGGGSPFSFEIIPVTVTAANTWTAVPLSAITQVVDIEIFDQFNKEKVLIDSRIISGGAEIRSKKITTFTVHIQGV